MSKKKNHDRAPDKIGFSVALPKSLVWQIEEIAQEEHRSRNGQIEHFLAAAVAEWKREHPQPLAHVAEEQAPYGTKPTIRRDVAGEILKARAAQPSSPPTAPSPKPPAPAKGKS